jgi:hypothetical protein
MRRHSFLLVAVAVLSFVYAAGARAGGLGVSLAPGAGNPPSPQMGDRLSFHSVIRNDGGRVAEGLIAWISLVQIDTGREQPMDLEDWSAHKAVTAASLAPGAALETDWPMRLIQPGKYRVVVSVVSRNAQGLTASPFVDFRVRPKPVVESRRVLPVAFGIPLAIFGAFLWRRRRG